MDLKNKYDPFSRFDTGKFDTGGFSNLSNQYDPFAKWDKPKKDLSGEDFDTTSQSDETFQSDSVINQPLAEPTFPPTNLLAGDESGFDPTIGIPTGATTVPENQPIVDNLGIDEAVSNVAGSISNAMQSGNEAYNKHVWGRGVDDSGANINLNKPLIVDKDGYIASEKTISVSGAELGMPTIGKYYNIPTIINGIEIDPKNAPALVARLLKSGEMNWDEIGVFDSQEEAIAASKSRSAKIGELRKGEIDELSENANEQKLRTRISEILNDKSPTKKNSELQESLFNILNPSVTNVYEKDGQWYRKNTRGSNRLNRLSGGLLDEEISREEAAYEIHKANTTVKTNNAINRGIGRLRSSFNVLNQQLGLIDEKEFLQKMMEFDRLYPDAPENIQKGLQAIVEADGFWASFKQIIKNPAAVISVVGESLPTSAPALATFAGLTTATGNPVVGATGGGAITFGSVFGIVLMEEIREYAAENKIDTNNEEAMLELMGNEKFWESARKRATGYSIPIAVFDALSMGLAGKIVSAGISKGASTGNILARSGAEVGMQGLFGGLGETGGQIGEMFTGHRDWGDLNEGEISLEAIAEIPLGGVEIAVGTKAQVNAANQSRLQNELKKEMEILEKNNLLRTSVDLLNPNSQIYQESVEQEVSSAPDVGNVENFTQRLQGALDAVSEDDMNNNEVTDLMSEFEKLNDRPFEEQEEYYQKNFKTLNAALGKLEDIQSGDRSPTIDTTTDDAPEVSTEAPKAEDLSVEEEENPLGSLIENLTSEDQVETETPKLEEPKEEEIEAPKVEETIDEFDHKSIRAKFGEGGLTEEGSELLARIENGRINIKPDDKYNPKFVEQMKRVLRENQIPEAFLFYDEQQDSAPVYDLTNDGVLELFEFANTFNLKKQKADELGILERDVSFNNKDQFPDAPEVKTEPPKLETPKDVEVKNFPTEEEINSPTKIQEYVKPENTFEINFPSDSAYTEARLQVLQVAPNKWLTRSDVSFPEEGRSDKFSLRDKSFQTREAAISDLVERHRANTIIKKDDSKVTQKDRKAFSKFLDKILTDNGIATKAEETIETTEKVRTSSAAENKKIEPKTEPEIKPKKVLQNYDVGTVWELTDGKNKIYINRANDGFGNWGWYRTTKNGLGNVQPDGRFAGDDGQPPLQYAFTKNEAIDKAKEQLRNPKGILFPVQTGRPKGKKSGDTVLKDVEIDQGEIDARTDRSEENNQDRQDGSFVYNAEDVQIENIKKRGYEDFQASTKGKTTGRIILQEMQNPWQSLYQQVIAEARTPDGKPYDPNKIINTDPANIFRIISEQTKKKFGFKYIQRGKDNNYDANQALMDGYRNMQWMSNALQLPNESMGLDGTLGLVLPGRQWGGYNAAYFPKSPNMSTGLADSRSDAGTIEAAAIIMPARSNSFAHEWGHALDYFIMERFGDDIIQEISGQARKGITGTVRTSKKPWQDITPKDIKESMADLLVALFSDNSQVAATLMQKEQELAKTKAWEAKTGKVSKKSEQLEAQIKKLKEGAFKSKKVGESQYKKDVKKFAKGVANPEYWTEPTEMFARAFEAYIADLVTARNGTTEFITKQDEAYKLTIDQVSGGDERLALTYPNEPDRTNIKLAMDRFMDAVRANFFENTKPAEAPVDAFILNANLDFAAELDLGANQNQIKDIWKKEQRQMQAAKIDRMKTRPRRYSELKADIGNWSAKRFYRNAEDLLLSRIGYSKRGILFTISDRYKDKPEIRQHLEEIIRRVATDPGGRRKTFTNGTFEEATTREGRRFASRLKNIVDVHKLDLLKPTQEKDLRLILTGDEKTQAKYDDNDPLVLAAGEIRNKLLNPLYDYMRNNNVNVSYLANGSYMPRTLDIVKLFDQLDNFVYGEFGATAPIKGHKKGAFNLYRDVIYKEELGDFDPNNEDQMLALAQLGQKLPFDGTIEAFDLVQDLGKLAQDIKRSKQRIADLEKQLEKQTGEEAEKTKIIIDNEEESITKSLEEAEEIHEEVYEGLKDPFAQASVNDLKVRMSIAQGSDPEAHTVYNSFTKKRTFPKEADSYLVDYYVPPVESLVQYIPAVVRKTEYQIRFGSQLIPKGSRVSKLGFGTKPNFDFLEYLMEQATETHGMDTQDAQIFRLTVEKALGRDSISKDTAGKRLLDSVHAYGTMALLPRAVVASIAEPLTAGVQTGSVVKGAKTFALTWDGALGLVSKNAKERTVFYKQVANVLGVIDDPATGEMIANRLGGMLAENPQLNQKMSRYFVRTGLVTLTNAQRRSAMRVMLQYLAEISAEYQNPNTSDKSKKRIQNILQDYGIHSFHRDQFTKWMAESRNNQFKMPNIEEIQENAGQLSDMGKLLATAVGRMVDETIQNPKLIDRPLYAEHPLGRLVYGIQSFLRAYTRNVLIGSGKKIVREYQDNGFISGTTMTAIQMLPNFLTLYGGHFIVSSIREALLNPDKWDEEKENGTLEKYLLELAFMRAGFAGGFDPIWNVLRSTRYQADVNTLLVGASVSFYSKAFIRLIAGVNPYVNNSPNTLSTEYQTFIGGYDILGTYLLTQLASSNRLGNILGTAAGLGTAIATSPGIKHLITRNIIELLYGETYSPKKGGSKTTHKDFWSEKSPWGTGSKDSEYFKSAWD